MRRLRLALAIAALVFAGRAGTLGQARDAAAGATAPGTISGRVESETDHQRGAVRRATVTLRRATDGQAWTTASDADGRFRFDDVTMGPYRLQATKPGFVSAPVDVEIEATGARTVSLDMQRAGALEGRFTDDYGDPIARLSVIADSVSDASELTTTATAYSALTDDLGRFRVHTLPPGQYRLHATPPPPAAGSVLFYPGTSNPSEATTIAVASGQTRDHLDFTVPRAPLSPIEAAIRGALERLKNSAPLVPGQTAQISGRVTRADTGRPIENATASLASAPGAKVSTVNNARANADGRFEFTRLAAGEYVLSVGAGGYLSADSSLQRPAGAGTRIVVTDGQRFDRADIVLLPASAIEGRVLDEFGDPAPGIVVQMTKQVQVAGVPRFFPGVAGAITLTGPTDDRGWFRAYGLFPGDYYLLAIPEPFERSGPAPFRTTYFPGTAWADAATAVHIVAGIDAFGAEFTLVPSRAAAISGVVVDQAGQPASPAQITLIPIEDGEVRAMVMARTMADANGRFSYRDVPEGTYVLQGMGDKMFGSRPVTVPAVADRDAPALALTLRPLTTARGRVVFEGDSAPRPDPESVTVGFESTNYTTGPVGSNVITSRIAADSTFEIPNLAWHGVLFVRTRPGWALARVQLQGRDITDTPYDFQTADVNGIEVIVTNRLGGVSGRVTSGGLPVAGATVIVFSADSATVTAFSRTQRAGRTNDQGVFTLTGLLPGRYLAVAMPAADSPAAPTSIPAFRSLGTPFVVTEGANATVTLTIVK